MPRRSATQRKRGGTAMISTNVSETEFFRFSARRRTIGRKNAMAHAPHPTSGRPAFPLPAIPLGAALRRAFSKGYGLRDLRMDLLAGIVVGIVALPLSMA